MCDGVDLFKPTSAFVQTAGNWRMKYPGWKLNNVSEKGMLAVDAGDSTACRILHCMYFLSVVCDGEKFCSATA